MVYDKQNIILGNLCRAGAEQTAALEKRLAHLGELAGLLAEEAGEEEIFFRDPGFAAAYRELMRRSAAEGGAPVNAERLSVIGGALTAFERAYVCRRLTDSLGIRGIRSVGTYFEDYTDDGNETVCYVPNSYADEAFSRFAGRMKEPKVLYGHDFTEICESVYYERAAYCLLPIENSSDGRLAGFRRLIAKYGLKTVMTTSVKTAQEGEATVFALMRKNIVIPDCPGDKFFELRIRTDEALTALLCAADACLMKPVSLYSVPERAGFYDAVFAVSEEGICGFLSFLFLEYRDFRVTGFFGTLQPDDAGTNRKG